MIISITNQKGGVSKTISTLNLGAALSLLNKSTLLIDMDYSTNLSNNLGVITDHEKGTVKQYDIVEFLNGNPKFTVVEKAPNLYLLPGSIDLEPTSRFDLKTKLNLIKDNFDFIIIDTRPEKVNKKKLSLTEMCLVASEGFLVPLTAKHESLTGFDAIIRSIFEVKENHNSSLIFLGVFFTQINVSSKNESFYREELNYLIQDHLFNTFIRNAVAVDHAVRKGLTLFQHQPNSNPAMDYLNLANELISHINKNTY